MRRPVVGLFVAIGLAVGVAGCGVPDGGGTSTCRFTDVFDEDQIDTFGNFVLEQCLHAPGDEDELQIILPPNGGELTVTCIADDDVRMFVKAEDDNSSDQLCSGPPGTSQHYSFVGLVGADVQISRDENADSDGDLRYRLEIHTGT
jgi:hypothetical protein